MDVPPAEGPVLVGVSRSPATVWAVRWAADEAALNGARLVAVEVRRPHQARAGAYEESRPEVAEALADWREKYPQVEAELRILTGYPAHLLAEQARRARCPVVGSHERSGWRDALLDSTTRSLVHHTHSPLVVVPPQYTGGA
ncbi:universal stress protein [Streptacidiphilus neutrinimicus]|uniref:universal stress protein n=1 Tax=Streptacidiphilus neutrinimicus TaxID=105420 RepID=UPI000694B9B5|nr:universal stress protein [Streptacidiphilus neutrinimicus]